MQCAVFVVTVLAMACSANAAKCGDGQKHKATLTGLYCDTAFIDKNGCQNCCEQDTTTCYGQGTTHTAVCGTGKYVLSANANKATTTATKVADCCAAVATCADVGSGDNACIAGSKKVSATTRTCSEGVYSCGGTKAERRRRGKPSTVTPSDLGASDCCEKDPATCGGAASITCKADRYDTSLGWNDLTTAEQPTAAVKDTWRATAIASGASDQDVCCTAQATCADYTCAAGSKAKSPTPTTKCSRGAKSCSWSTCCELDSEKCGGGWGSCPSGKYSKPADTTGKTEADCCLTKATCGASPSCNAGYIADSTQSATTCTSDQASCKPTSGAGVCCKLDVLKCGGFSEIRVVGTMGCAPGTFLQTADLAKTFGIYTGSATLTTAQEAEINALYNKATTASTKALDCCVAKATCTAFKAKPDAANIAGAHQKSQPAAFILVALSVITMAMWHQ